jgi:hypothetical protein
MLSSRSKGHTTKNFRSGTLLHLAIYFYNIPAVEVLLNHGCDVDPLNDYLSTPLHYAARHYKRVVLDQFIKAGANFNCQDGLRQFPAMISARKGIFPTLKLFTSWDLTSDTGIDMVLLLCIMLQQVVLKRSRISSTWG